MPLPCPVVKSWRIVFMSVRAGTNPPKASKTFAFSVRFFSTAQNPQVRASNRCPDKNLGSFRKSFKRTSAWRFVASLSFVDAPCWECPAALVSINGGISQMEVPLFAPREPIAATFLLRPSARLQSTRSRQGLIALNARRFSRSRRKIVPYSPPARCYLSFQQFTMLNC